ncbi:hypothetical protein ACFX13_012590 [Malus domestica]
MYPGFGKVSGPTGPPGSQPLFGNFGCGRPPSPSPPTTPLFPALLRCVFRPGSLSQIFFIVPDMGFFGIFEIQSINLVFLVLVSLCLHVCSLLWDQGRS